MELPAYSELVDRNIGVITEAEQKRLRQFCVAVVGCGGIGGIAAELLARAGLGKIKMIDNDQFEATNMNRQLFSAIPVLGREKTEVARERLQTINPYMEIETYSDKLSENNAKKMLRGSDVVLDALDNLEGRVIVSRSAQELGLPFIHGAVHGAKGEISVFLPEGPTYEEVFGLPSTNKKLTDSVRKELLKLQEKRLPILGSAPIIVGSIQVAECIKLITGHDSPVIAPKVLFFDLFAKNPFKIETL